MLPFNAELETIRHQNDAAAAQSRAAKSLNQYDFDMQLLEALGQLPQDDSQTLPIHAYETAQDEGALEYKECPHCTKGFNVGVTGETEFMVTCEICKGASEVVMQPLPEVERLPVWLSNDFNIEIIKEAA